MSRTRKISLWIFALVISLSGLFFFNKNESVNMSTTYKTDSIVQGDITLHVLTTGTINPLIKVQVGSQVSGTILELNTDFNQHVKKGDLIARIEPALFEARVAMAKANLRSAEAGSEKVQVELRDARRQLKRKKRLRKQNMVSESEMDDALFNYEKINVEYKAQLAKIEEAKATLQLAQVNLAYTTIYSPIDGIIMSRDVDVGQTVAASLQAPTLFTIAQDLTKMQIEAYVDEAFIGMIRENQPVSFSVYAYPEKKYTGNLVQIRLSPNTELDVVRYNCIIEVDNSDLSLKPGMTATVTIQVAERKNILKVPNAALRYIPEMSPQQLIELRKKLNPGRHQKVIWLPSPTGPKPIMVNTGLSAETETEVTGNNIQSGMQIILNEKKAKKSSKRKLGLRLF